MGCLAGCRLTGGTLGVMALSSIIVLFILYRWSCLVVGPAGLGLGLGVGTLGRSAGWLALLHAGLGGRVRPVGPGMVHGRGSPPAALPLPLGHCRKVPHKGKLLAGTAIFGSTFLAAMRWLFGVWLPSLHQASHPGRRAAAPAPHPLVTGILPSAAPACMPAFPGFCTPSQPPLLLMSPSIQPHQYPAPPPAGAAPPGHPGLPGRVWAGGAGPDLLLQQHSQPQGQHHAAGGAAAGGPGLGVPEVRVGVVVVVVVVVCEGMCITHKCGYMVGANELRWAATGPKRPFPPGSLPPPPPAAAPPWARPRWRCVPPCCVPRGWSLCAATAPWPPRWPAPGTACRSSWAARRRRRRRQPRWRRRARPRRPLRLWRPAEGRLARQWFRRAGSRSRRSARSSREVRRPGAGQGRQAQLLTARCEALLSAGSVWPRVPTAACRLAPLPAGLVLNEETGHIIGIGKGTYNRLGGFVQRRRANTSCTSCSAVACHPASQPALMVCSGTCSQPGSPFTATQPGPLCVQWNLGMWWIAGRAPSRRRHPALAPPAGPARAAAQPGGAAHPELPPRRLAGMQRAAQTGPVGVGRAAEQQQLASYGRCTAHEQRSSFNLQSAAGLNCLT